MRMYLGRFAPSAIVDGAKTILVVAALFVLGAAVAVASHGDPYINLAEADAVVEHDGSVYTQGGVGAGTGQFDPFTTANPGGSTSPEEAVTVCSFGGCPAPQFHTFTGGDRTHELLLSAVPELTFSGDPDIPDGTYREFTLDANDTGNDSFMSIDDIHILLDTEVDLTGYDPIAQTFTPDAAPTANVVYDLNLPILMESQTLEPGSGVSDITVLIPTSQFVTPEDCSYGSTDCEHYLYFYFLAGAYDGAQVPAGLEGTDWDVSSGFEEWRTRFLPVVNVTKTADTSFDREYDWTITKTVNDEEGITLDLFDGDDQDVTWKVVWDRSDPTDSNIQVTGTIEIYNPTGAAGSPISEDIDAEIINVTDVLAAGGFDGEVEVDCGFDFSTGTFTLESDETLVCTYTQSVTTTDNGTNTATAIIEGFMGPQNYTDTVDVDFSTATINEIDEEATIEDLRAGAEAIDGLVVDGDGMDSWTENFACDADEGEESNTATITENDSSESSSDTATVDINCYTPTISKTAQGDYDEGHTWEIEKSVSPENLDGFIGGSAGTVTWTIEVDHTVGESNFAVTGNITITNPHPTDSLVADVTDVLDDAGATGGTITSCVNPAALTGSDQVTVAADSSETCAYSVSPSGRTAANNTASFELFGITYSDTEGFTWNENVVGDDMVTLNDDRNPMGFPKVLTGDDTVMYDESFSCSDQVGDYTDGFTTDDHDNTATLTGDETNLSDDATVTVDCYAPVVTKDASASYDENQFWEIEKTVSPENLDGFIGGSAGTVTWTIVVDHSTTDTNFAVSGQIMVENPHPTDTMTVDLADELDDGTLASIDSCIGGTLTGSSLEIAALTTATCDYSATPADASATLNTATATINSVDVSGTAAVTYVKNIVGDDMVTLDDDRNPAGFPKDLTGDDTVMYDESFSCSDQVGDYTDGFRTDDYDNTATLTGDETNLSDDATVTVDCYAPVVSKTANTSFDRMYNWDIEKTSDVTELMLSPGQIFQDVQYDVTVSITSMTVSNYAADGTITVDNPHPDDAMTVSLSDQLNDGTPVTNITCDVDANLADGLTVPAASSASCTWDVGGLDGDEASNTATATINSVDVTGSADLDWGAATVNETDESITLSDTWLPSPINGATVTASEAPKTLSYLRDIGPYTIEQCGEVVVDNTAAFVTNDTAATGDDDHQIVVVIPCPTGCTLTQGYWKTHSQFGPAPFDDAWFNLGDVDGDGVSEGADEDFFGLLAEDGVTALTWFDVMWTPPKKGNANLILAHQYIAALLNRLNDAADPGGIDSILDAATTYFENLPDDELFDKLPKPESQQLKGWAGTLANYNEGSAGIPHCDEDSSSLQAFKEPD